MPPGRPISNDLSVNLLLEHTKAGKAVGTKGTMMQTIKNKSGATSIRIEKEPMDVNGVSLRKLTIEGSLISVRRAHLLVQELYTEPGVLTNSAAYSGFPNGPAPIDPMSGSPLAHPAQIRPMQPGYGNGPAAYEAPAAVDPASVHMVQVPFPTLINYGVQAETVRQLTEMKAYLWRHVRLFSVVFLPFSHSYFVFYSLVWICLFLVKLLPHQACNIIDHLKVILMEVILILEIILREIQIVIQALIIAMQIVHP